MALTTKLLIRQGQSLVVRETLGLIDRAYIIHSGTVLTQGLPEEIVENADVRRLYLGEDFRF